MVLVGVAGRWVLEQVQVVPVVVVDRLVLEQVQVVLAGVAGRWVQVVPEDLVDVADK